MTGGGARGSGPALGVPGKLLLGATRAPPAPLAPPWPPAGGGSGLPLPCGVPNRNNRLLAPGAPPSRPSPRSLSGTAAETAPLASLLLSPRLSPLAAGSFSPGQRGRTPSPSPGRAPRYLALGIAPRGPGPGPAPRRHGDRAGHAGSRSSAAGRKGTEAAPIGAVARLAPPPGGGTGAGAARAALASALPAVGSLWALPHRGTGLLRP